MKLNTSRQLTTYTSLYEERMEDSIEVEHTQGFEAQSQTVTLNLIFVIRSIIMCKNTD